MPIHYTNLATSDGQEQANTTLTAILSAVQNIHPDNLTIESILNAITTATTGSATAANQVTGNTSLASILSTHSTGVKQDTGNASLASIDAKIGSLTSALTNVTQSPTSVTLLPANANRKGFLLYNDSSVKCMVSFGTTASATAFTVLLPANSGYEPLLTTIYKGAITAIWSSGTAGAMRVTELT